MPSHKEHFPVIHAFPSLLRPHSWSLPLPAPLSRHSFLFPGSGGLSKTLAYQLYFPFPLFFLPFPSTSAAVSTELNVSILECQTQSLEFSPCLSGISQFPTVTQETV